MANDDHRYRIRTTSMAIRSGLVVAEGVEPPIAFSAPVEFRGEPGLWTPEHFLVAAVSSCYVSTFSGTAEASKFAFVSLDLESEGILEKEQSGWRFKQIILRPRLTIAHAKDGEQASRLLHKAEKNCLVGRSLSCQIVLEPEIKIEEVPVAT
jgi:peroxiredoxin-like protein